MTEIPFVARLGDALDTAIAATPDLRAQARRRLAVPLVAVALALAIAAIAVAHVLSGPDELATQSIACYTSPDLSSDVTVVADDRGPVAACADAYRRMGVHVPPLVACRNGSTVAVIAAAGESACVRAGLAPLPPSFAASQEAVARLARAVIALEDRQDCTPMNRLAKGVQRLLLRQGWVGWNAELRPSASGPCATVSTLDGSGRRRIDGALDARAKLVLVSGSAARSTLATLYGVHGLARALEDASGAQCYTVAALTAVARARAAASGRAATIELAPPLPTTVRLADDRQARYEAGCAVVTDVRPASDGRNIVAVVPRPER